MSLLFAILEIAARAFVKQRKDDDEKLAKEQDGQAAKNKADAMNSSRPPKKRTRKSR